MTPLVTADELAALLDQVRCCDLRWDLTDPEKGRSNYEAGHIPGAVFVDLDADLAAPPGIDGRHPLPDVADFARTLGRLGIERATHVVAYDDVGGRIAARLWWMLRAIGHEKVQVLDGGLRAWSGEIETGSTDMPAASYPVPERFAGVVAHDELEGRPVIDARAGERYRGEVEPVDPKAGHIPGAVNIPTAENLDGRGLFLPPGELLRVYSDTPHDVVVSCGSGVTACHDALAMVVAGRAMPDVYVGSFSEWSRRDLPVSTGPEP